LLLLLLYGGQRAEHRHGRLHVGRAPDMMLRLRLE